MVVALALWCSGPQIFSALGLEEEARMMTAPVIAVLMGASAFLVPIRRDRESGRLIFAMNWDQAVRNIGWGIIVLQIGAIAFGQVLLKGGVDKWMAQCIQMLTGGERPVVRFWATSTACWSGSHWSSSPGSSHRSS